MIEKLCKPVLVLNKNWTAIGTSPVYKALNLLFSLDNRGMHKAVIIGDSCIPYTWKEWSLIKPKNEYEAIRTVDIWYKIPEIIRLTSYDRFPRQTVIFSRANIFKRDGYECVYCGSKKHLTLDHVLPKSRGGTNEWTNLVTCCSKCNRQKDNKTPEEAKMSMSRSAYEPPIMYDDVVLLNVWTEFQKSFG
jgi:5-methylcytosine-specific restriction endonuclease McrA